MSSTDDPSQPGTTEEPPGTPEEPPGTTEEPPGTPEEPPGTPQEPPSATEEPPTGGEAAEHSDTQPAEAERPASGSFTPVDAVLTGAMSADGMLAGPGGAEAPARPRRRLALLLGASAVVVAVLAAGAAYAVLQRWDKPTGALPEERLPASVAAFARVNLTPGLGQRVKFEELLRKSKGAPPDLDGLERELFEDLRAPVTYADVAPWFDDRIGVAMWAAPAHPDRAVTLVAASARDEQQARGSLDALQRRRGTDHVGFVVEDGYVLLAVGDLDAQGTATAAAAEAKRAPLAKDPGFRAAIATLPGDQPAIGWADLAKANRLSPELGEEYVPSLIGGVGFVEDPVAGPVARPGAGPLAGPSTSPRPADVPALDPHGVAVFGLRAADDALEATVRLIGVNGLPLGTNAGKTDVVEALGGLSGDASAAGVIAGPLGDLTKVLGPGAAYLPMSLFGTAMLPPGPLGESDRGDLGGPGDLPPGFVVADPETIKRYMREHPEMFADVPEGDLRIITGDEVVERLRVGAQPDKLAAALASGLGAARTVSFAVAGKAGEESPETPLLLDLRMADAAAAARTQQELADLAKFTKVKCEQHEDHVVLRSDAYAGGTSRLADDPLFRRAMAGAVASPVAAVYLAGSAVGEPVRAVGVTAGRAGADTVLQARLVVA
ncbi:hypothetical protein ACQP2P_06790 [Dactylosporangium sp. CA-139114]|uniref:hypothetical protein n=1 Tax=Dactylosporangium sp. CA-139114 TaxID=3239931 RepID=UPI003D998748